MDIDPKTIPPITHSNENLKRHMIGLLEKVIGGAMLELQRTEAQLKEAINVWSSTVDKSGK